MILTPVKEPLVKIGSSSAPLSPSTSIVSPSLKPKPGSSMTTPSSTLTTLVPPSPSYPTVGG